MATIGEIRLFHKKQLDYNSIIQKKGSELSSSIRKSIHADWVQ